ncbi:tetratricopeptide repeat protein [Terriglobus albidus]|uniref:tetratricopeptide repeat protein n=1 Tax=Terriglobus albidus TaxID=1592106 RepID=UPI00164DA2F0|nr:tetratricopeptide repeat protein [Terriglobus albidus]
MEWNDASVQWFDESILRTERFATAIHGGEALVTSMPQDPNSLTGEEIDALWSIRDPVNGEIKLKKALTEYPASADELHTQIARSQGLQGRFHEAWEEIAKVSTTPHEVVQIRVQLESGRLKNTSGDTKESQAHFLKAFALAKQGHFDFYAVDAAHMLGIVSEGQESIQWNEKALKLAANSKNERARKWRGSLLNNLGWSYFNMGDFNTALVTFESALEFQQTTGNPVRIRIPRWAVARCLRALKRYDEAFAIQNDLIQYPEQGYVSEELGELLLVMGRPDEAKPRFRRAYELLSPSLSSDPNERTRLAPLKELSQ